MNTKLLLENYEAELKRGTEVEKEHKKTYFWAKAYVKTTGQLPSFEKFCESIAKDHLEEHSDYYTRLDKAEL